MGSGYWDFGLQWSWEFVDEAAALPSWPDIYQRGGGLTVRIYCGKTSPTCWRWGYELSCETSIKRKSHCLALAHFLHLREAPVFSEHFDQADRLRGGKLMSAANSSNRIWFSRAKTVPPVNRVVEHVRHYFDQHPEVPPEEFLLEALRREVHFREQKEPVGELGLACRKSQRAYRRFSVWPQVTAEDIRFHAWLNERLAALDYERHGLWPKVRELLFGNRLVRWLANT
jgi:hypothetical protein